MTHSSFLRRFAVPMVLLACVTISGCFNHSGEEAGNETFEAQENGDPSEQHPGQVTGSFQIPEPLEPTRGVILISLDTLRADRLGLYGYRKPTSPFLDQLAHGALVFENAFSQYPSTLTSHMTMLTGLYPAEHGVYPPSGVLSADIPLLAEVFRGAGYRTGGFTEAGYVRGHFGFRRGFEAFKARDRRGREQTRNTFNRGLRFLESLEEEDPFFLFLHTYAVHAPYQPDAEFKELFWPGLPPPGAITPDGPSLRAENAGPRLWDKEVIEHLSALYDAEIRQLDAEIERLFQELERMGLLGDTTVVLTSDHGEEFAEHGRLQHEQLYQEILAVPLLVVHPALGSLSREQGSQGSGFRSQQLVELVDLMPSILELQKLTVPPGVSGRSFLPSELQERAVASWPYAENLQERSVIGAISGQTYHLLRFGGSRPDELYQLENDPLEEADLLQAEDTGALADALEVKAVLTEQLTGLDHSLKSSPGSLTVSSEEKESLRALGYVTDDG